MSIAALPTDIAALTPPPAAAAITGVIDGYKHYQALRAGYRSGLFDWLQAQPDGVERSAIAEALDLRGAHLGAFLQSLQDLGLLEREGARYRLAADAAPVLCTDSAWCRAGALADLEDAGNGWSDLQRFLRQDWTQSALAVTPPAHAPFLGEVRRLLDALAGRDASRQALARARTLLCFDGSGGLLAAAIGQRFPQLEITVVVPPAQFANAAVRLRDLAFLEGRPHALHAGTPLEPPMGEPCDYAIVFHALYPVRKSTDAALAQVAERLASGGEVCLAHWFCLEACETAPGGLRDLDKAVLTDSHPLCGIERFGQRLEQAGLTFADRQDASGEYGNTKLHFARKPAA
ncbi:hypothetical protein H9L17_14060 [Thermomonas brevis]|uniref:Methyltransferase n=1 Tax=Thermomonas brevis TaxID=215691 RepID=A0A7G9QSF2_9GAMM|nr:hypothetical protein [Thermomonas brevis]QNN46277.1 hypothetical protein H9L17_14060 [Thermomonas brevis]